MKNLLSSALLLIVLVNSSAFVTFIPQSSISSLRSPSKAIQHFSPSNIFVGFNRVFFSSDGNGDLESSADRTEPKTFRDAEILGLRLMQDGTHKEALIVFQRGLKLPGSRVDIIRTKTLAGPSPVGGSAGGTEGKTVLSLDEFELQAAHYNIACACSRLGKFAEAIKSLEEAFNSGFDNYATVRSDPDLAALQDTNEFNELMKEYESKSGFPNPFSFFGGK